MKISLQELTNRLNTDIQLLEKHPEHKEMLEKRINEHKEEIIKTCLINSCNPYLSYINNTGSFPG